MNEPPLKYKEKEDRVCFDTKKAKYDFDIENGSRGRVSGFFLTVSTNTLLRYMGRGL